MKVAIVSESPADEAAIKILVDKVLGSESDIFTLRTRPYGWTRIFDLLPTIIPGLHYGTDVEGLVVVIDSDESPLHQAVHDIPNSENPGCRLCRLRATVRAAMERLRALPTRSALQTALGLAVPAMEAWYRAGLDSHISEIAWGRKLLGENVSYDKRSLKIDTYGSAQPSLVVETSTALSAARRLSQNLAVLEELFPNGFGCLLRDLRDWR